MLEKIYEKHCTESDHIIDGKIVESRNAVYCPNCSRANHYDNTEFSDAIACLDYDVVSFTCSHCGKTHYIQHHRWGIPNISRRKMAKNTRLYTDTVSSIQFANPSGVKTTELICHDKENGKLFIMVRFLNFIPGPRRLIIEPYYNKYIINYKKHTSHIVSKRKFNGKPAFGSTTRQIINQTNAKDGLSHSRVELWYISKETLMVFAKKYCELAGYDDMFDAIVDVAQQRCQQMSHYYSDEENFKACLYSELITLNRFPNLLIGYDEYTKKKSCLLDFEVPFIDKYFEQRFPKTLVDRQNWIRSTALVLKLPISKTFWNMYLTNVCNMDKVYYLTRCGFTNPDIMRNILKHESEIFPEHMYRTYFEVIERKNMYDTLRKVIKRMVASSGEHSVATKIINSNRRSYIEDIAMMYRHICQSDKLLLNTIDWTGSFKDVHDELSLLSSKLENVNVAIKYSAKEKTLEREVGECQFQLAVDTNELVAIGQKMKICVGSYRDAVLSKRSTIVAMTKNGQYVGCIEVDSHNSIVQMKASRNRYLIGDIGEAAKKWVKEVGLNTNNCWDYKNIGVKIDSNADYHHLELDADGNVFDPRAIVNDDRPFFDDDEWLPF